ncbi:unnamed protein product, partial [Staurois parvus]
MQLTLQKFGITGWMMKAILSLYSQPSASVLTDGTLSDPFDISNGTRQGCPLSPIIFTLLNEPLASKLREDRTFTHFIHFNMEHKISLFADDIILMVSTPKKSLQTIHSHLYTYSTVSYYKLNEPKSSILNLHISAQLQIQLAKQFPFLWETNSIPYL